MGPNTRGVRRNGEFDRRRARCAGDLPLCSIYLSCVNTEAERADRSSSLPRRTGNLAYSSVPGSAISRCPSVSTVSARASSDGFPAAGECDLGRDSFPAFFNDNCRSLNLYRKILAKANGARHALRSPQRLAFVRLRVFSADCSARDAPMAVLTL